jgi:hypothetical protein
MLKSKICEGASDVDRKARPFRWAQAHDTLVLPLRASAASQAARPDAIDVPMAMCEDKRPAAAARFNTLAAQGSSSWDVHNTLKPYLAIYLLLKGSAAWPGTCTAKLIVQREYLI